MKNKLKYPDNFGMGIMLDTKYRTWAEGYEYLSRLAANSPHNSMKRIIDERIFRRGWRKELDSMRVIHRKLGIEDHEFYHPMVRKALGLKHQTGRKKRRSLKAAHI